MSKPVVISMVIYQPFVLPESFHALNLDIATPTMQRKDALYSWRCSNSDDQTCTQMVLFQDLFKETTKCSYQSAILFQFFVWVFLCLFFLFLWFGFCNSARLSQTKKKMQCTINHTNWCGQQHCPIPKHWQAATFSTAPWLEGKPSSSSFSFPHTVHLSYEPAPMKALFLTFLIIGQLKLSLQ